jgi:hypothetical protein
MTAVQDATPTCASRAYRAVGAQRRTLHGDAPSAHPPGRDGRRAVRTDDMLRDRNCTCRVRRIRRTRAAAREPQRTSTLRGVTDPHRRWPGGRTGHATPGSFTPRFHPPSGRGPRRTAHGAVRSRRHRRAQPAAAPCLSAMVENKCANTGGAPTCRAAQALGDKFASGTCPP